MTESISRPRTSRFRGGHAFEERRTNAWAAFIGFLLGRGYSSVAVAESLADGTDDATVRLMAKKWGLRAGRDNKANLSIPLTVLQRAHIAARAGQNGLSVEEYCRRMLVCGAMPKDRYSEIVPEEQF